VVITPDQTLMALIPSATVSFPMFSGLSSVSLTNFQLLTTGFTLGSLSLNSSGTITIPGIAQIGSLSVTVSNFAFNYGSPSTIGGMITVSAGSVTLFPSLSFLTATASNVQGSFNFDSVKGEILELDIASLDISLGSALVVHASAVHLQPSQTIMATVSSATVSFFGSALTGSISSLKFLTTGLDFSSATLTLNNPNLGSFVSFDSI
jgi:hypothetical protein